MLLRALIASLTFGHLSLAVGIPSWDKQLDGRAVGPDCNITAISPPPSGFHCNEQGTLSKSATPIGSPSASTFDACKNACFAWDGCVSFGFKKGKTPRTSTCSLYGSTLDSLGFKSSTTSGIQYSNKRCYRVSCPTCPTSQTFCSASKSCKNLNTDDANCGGCGNLCSDGTTCQSGVCKVPPFYLVVSGSGTAADNTYYWARDPTAQVSSYYSGFNFYSPWTRRRFTIDSATGYLNDVDNSTLYLSINNDPSYMYNPVSLTPAQSQFSLLSCSTGTGSLVCSVTVGGGSNTYSQFALADTGSTLNLYMMQDGASAPSYPFVGPVTVTPTTVAPPS